MTDLQHHIKCTIGDVARTVLLPGDPARAELIAGHFDEARKVASNREFTTFTGKTGGVPVSVTSTGIGGPSTVIAVEELVRCGADTFIRVGTSGGMQPELIPGELAILTGAIRDEGTTLHYLPVEFPAVADLDVTNALVAAAQELEPDYRVGLAFTRDAYYVQDHALNELLTAHGIEAAEQEAAILFITGTHRRVQVGAVVATDSNIWLAQQPTLAEKETLYMLGEKKVIGIALRAVQIMAGRGQ